MSKINVQGLNDVVDPFYRYTMDKMILTKQKHKTLITNGEKIAKDLERDPLLITSFFKKRLGISMSYKEGVITIVSDINYDILEKVLREFIEICVLCDKCKLPETIIDNNKSNNKSNKSEIVLLCKCCSFVSTKQYKY